MAIFYGGDALIGARQYWLVPVDTADWAQLSFKQAMVALTEQSNWESLTALSPEDCAAYFFGVFESMNYYPNPTGSIVPYACDVSTLIPFALPCDGASYAKLLYPSLYAAIGETFGGDATNFNVPDLRGRFPLGAGTLPSGTTIAIADSGGSDTHVQTSGELAVHAHTDLGHVHGYVPALPNGTTIGPGAPQPTAIPGVGSTSIGNANIQNAGNSDPMDIINPYLAINYAIITGF